MKKVLYAMASTLAMVAVIGTAAAAFTDTADVTENTFEAGTMDLQVSDSMNGFYDDTLTAVWTTPTGWAPGETFEQQVWFYNNGTVDINSLMFDMSDRVRGGAAALDTQVNLTSAWYDANANETRDAGEGILSALMATYAGGDGELTLQEMYNAMAGGTLFDLASADTITAGEKRGLYLEWTFDADAGNVYQGTTVDVDFDFTGSTSN